LKDGKIIVWMSEPDQGSLLGAEGVPEAARLARAAARLSLQRSQAAALSAAAGSGVPFCEECAQVKRLRAGKTK